MPGTSSPAVGADSPPARFELAGEVSVHVDWEIQDGRPLVRMLIRGGKRPTLMLAPPDQAEGWMAGILREGGADDLADALCRAARDARQFVARRACRQAMPPRVAQPRTKAVSTILAADRQQAVDSARRLAVAAGQGPRAVSELLGCPNDNALFMVAFGSAIAAIGRLLAIIDEPGGQTGRGLEEWSTTQELCAWLGIEVPALSWLHQCGEGPRRYRIGKENRFRRAEVEAWLVTRTAGDLVDAEPARRRR
jgi:predicted DNA-binding transcriptional regulator AlpA